MTPKELAETEGKPIALAWIDAATAALREHLESLAAGIGAYKPLVLGTTDDEFTMVTDGVRGRVRLLHVSASTRPAGSAGIRPKKPRSSTGARDPG